ncbi:unnamed protein product [Calicophoron daubneyi]|uniref:Espin n=1 Tax=Calicophoron daubneyi TaxID=300641 RepID=A0AAV2SXT1_CALDB
MDVCSGVHSCASLCSVNGKRSASPHSSVGSSGSEEVRCSLDELDAVIATFDEEARRQRYSLACMGSSSANKDSQNLNPTDSTDFRRHSVSEANSFSTSTEPCEYSTATLCNRRHNSNNTSLQQKDPPDTGVDCNQMPSYSEDSEEFPPPPPDLFASDNFVLPPPPVQPTTNGSVVPLTISSPKSETQPHRSNVKNTAPGDSPSPPSCEQRPKSPKSTAQPVSPSKSRASRPSVPQRAPSTRLSSRTQPTVPLPSPSSPHAPPPSSPSVSEINQRKLSRGDQSPLLNQSGNVVSNGHKYQHHKSPGPLSCDPGSPERKTDSSPSIDRTVPPVGDIIRKFDQATQNAPPPSSLPLPPATDKRLSNGDHPHSILNGNVKETKAAQSPASPCHCSPATTPVSPVLPNSNGVASNGPDTSPLPTVQELARGFTAVAAALNSPAPVIPAGQTKPNKIKQPTQNVNHVTSLTSPLAVPSQVNGLNRDAPHTPPSGLTTLVPTPNLQRRSDVPVQPVQSSMYHTDFRRYSSSPSAVQPLSSFGLPATNQRIQSASLDDASSSPLPPPPSPHQLYSPPLLPSLSSPAVHISTTVTRTPTAPQILRIPPERVDSTFQANGAPSSPSMSVHQGPQLKQHVVQQLAGTLIHRRPSDTSCRDSGIGIPVQSMRLSAATLETLLQYNIVDASQIPGYQPVPMTGIPDWKLHKLERKNRDAADAYATDLRKWGRVPQWKRELIEKRQHGKTDYATEMPAVPTSQLDIQAEMQSLVSAELSAKLQRRLEKVASADTTA